MEALRQHKTADRVVGGDKNTASAPIGDVASIDTVVPGGCYDIMADMGRIRSIKQQLTEERNE